jgi:uncharacterized protein YlxW (UPF0749 family)
VTAPAPGRQRSLGASLLDQVLAETLDPAYAQAAAARAARPAGDPPGRSAPGWLHRSRSRMLVALVLVIAGLLASVTYREAAAGAQGREQAREALRSDIARESDSTDDLATQLRQLTGEVTRTRRQALAASAVGQRALDRLAAAEQAAALVAVTGPGLKVTLGNAPPAADSDPVGGSNQVALAGIVQDGDLQLLVNALWASGAEAISIDGQRIGATTAIRQAGDAILVDLRPVTNPYEVSAIGDPNHLTNAFLSTPEATSIASLSRDYGVVFQYARADRLNLPAGTGADLHFAQPLEPDAPATGAAPPAPDSTSPDPTSPDLTSPDPTTPDQTTDGG